VALFLMGWKAKVQRLSPNDIVNIFYAPEHRSDFVAHLAGCFPHLTPRDQGEFLNSIAELTLSTGDLHRMVNAISQSEGRSRLAFRYRRLLEDHGLGDGQTISWLRSIEQEKWYKFWR
jgi:hypothetical protein